MATEILRPNGLGAIWQLSRNGGSFNWDRVDEEVADDDTTYVYTTDSTTGERDLYALTDGVGAGTINGITVYVVCRRTSPSSAGSSVRIDINVGGSLYSSSSKLLTTSYATYSQAWATNPATGQPWEWAEIAALQAGAYLLTASGYETRMTQLYVEVDYEAGGVPLRSLMGVGR